MLSSFRISVATFAGIVPLNGLTTLIGDNQRNPTIDIEPEHRPLRPLAKPDQRQPRRDGHGHAGHRERRANPPPQDVSEYKGRKSHRYRLSSNSRKTQQCPNRDLPISYNIAFSMVVQVSNRRQRNKISAKINIVATQASQGICLARVLRHQSPNCKRGSAFRRISRQYSSLLRAFDALLRSTAPASIRSFARRREHLCPLVPGVWQCPFRWEA